MSIDYSKLRVDGIYQMNSSGDLMLRVKLAAGLISAEQAGCVAEIADAFAGGQLHLTTRGSIELHRLRYEQLADVTRRFARVGLTGRGACGGAVRGIACSTTASAGFEKLQTLARRLHRHFTGNPHFEGLPKKFKIGIDANAQGGRHLIQDVGLVLVADDSDGRRYDLWIAGGLGREPRPGFLYQAAVAEEAVIPLIEAIVRAYRKHAPAPKRLKHLAALHGEAGLRRLIEAEQLGFSPTLPPLGIEGSLTAAPSAGLVEVPVFAGELTSRDLRRLAAIAASDGDGFLIVTADQNLALIAADATAHTRLSVAIQAAGLAPQRLTDALTFRICPGTHACRMGLAPTRDVARQVIAGLGPQGESLSWAICGCPNSCSQPQLAEVGIIATRLTAAADESKTPLFTLLRRNDAGFGRVLAEGLTLEALLKRTTALN